MNPAAELIITKLGLAPLPHEGGFFRRTWTSHEQRADGRAAGSAIYFLLTPENYSALHRLRTDELWHFLAGDAVEHLCLGPGENLVLVTVLGADVPAGQVPQLVVPGGAWQGARLAPGHGEGLASSRAPARGWALLGCSMAPAWDEREFELGDRTKLARAFPAAAGLIAVLTR